MNTDGAHCANINLSYCDGVIIDKNEVCLKNFSRKIDSCSVLQVELWGALMVFSLHGMLDTTSLFLRWIVIWLCNFLQKMIIALMLMLLSSVLSSNCYRRIDVSKVQFWLLVAAWSSSTCSCAR